MAHHHLSELRLSSSILPHQCPRLETVTTRPGGAPCPEAERTMRGARRFARRKWPKWFEAMCSSRLSSVMYLFVSATPAFSIYQVVVKVRNGQNFNGVGFFHLLEILKIFCQFGIS